MGANPRIVTEDVTFQWDGVSQRLPRGQVMDVTPGSALEAAIGVHRLRPLGAVAAQPQAEPVVAQGGGGGEESPAAGSGGGDSAFGVTPASAPKSRTVGKKQDDEKDGDA